MTAVLLRLRTELRSRWRTWVSLTLILGLFGGAVIAIAATGVAAGRRMWTAFANTLGILPSPAIPVLAVLVTVPATLLLANLIAYLPGRAGGRVRAATVLRTE